MKTPEIDIYNYPDNPETPYMIAVMQAANDGSPVEFDYKGCPTGWRNYATFSKVRAPLWDWNTLKYRIAEPKVATPETIRLISEDGGKTWRRE